jgi:7-keto-8-aminopelargonate synthetase-like enzyme
MKTGNLTKILITHKILLEMTNTLAPNVELANQVIIEARTYGILNHSIQNHASDGAKLVVNGKNMIHFGNCGYLALANDQRLKDAAIDAINRYGISLPCSRTYASYNFHEEAEDLLQQIFGKPTVLSQNTTHAHMAAIPVLVKRGDAIIIDQQAHTSVHNATAFAQSGGAYVEMVRHNRMDMLESRLKKLSDKYDRIWFMTDGIFSMFGDVVPLDALLELCKTYPKLHLYIDDAHGMSWTGKHGKGYILDRLPDFHERLVLITSLGKGFGATGAAIVLPNEELKQVVLNVGPTLMFSTPIMPAGLAAIVASAKIHLSPEIVERQAHLSKLMSYFTLTAKSLKLQMVNEDRTPIYFVGVGKPRAGMEIARQMIDSGYMVSPSAFPSVPYNSTGIRTNLTINHTEQNIYDMLTTLANTVEDMERRNRLSRVTIAKTFALAS